MRRDHALQRAPRLTASADAVTVVRTSCLDACQGERTRTAHADAVVVAQACERRRRSAFTAGADGWCEEHPASRFVDAWRAAATALTPLRVAAWAARTTTAAFGRPTEQVVRRIVTRTAWRRGAAPRRAQPRRGSCRWVLR